jgi:quercetin dioxygenase-like cupin family protein
MRKKTEVSSLSGVPVERLFGGKVLRKVFSTENIEIVSYTYEEGSHFPEHSHPEEQVTIVEKGEITFELEGTHVKLGRGDVVYIPPDVPHSARAGLSGRAHTINIFYPPRKKRP